tara:strand:- start:1037 stop:1288 length:252 start_codon:yes stop_codon:yes gene_type:complete
MKITGKELSEKYGVSQKRASHIITEMRQHGFGQLEKEYANMDCTICGGKGLTVHPHIANAELQGAYVKCKHCGIHHHQQDEFR